MEFLACRCLALSITSSCCPLWSSSILSNDHQHLREMISSTGSYFGDGGASAKLSPDDFHASHRTLTHLMNEPFLSDATVKTRKAVEIYAPQIISSSSKQLGNVDHHGKFMDVDLYSFVINFVGGITGEILMGEAFCKNNPEILQDMWTFDDAFHSLLSGFPGLTSTGRTAVKARDRLISAVKDLQRAIMNMHNGNDNEHKWADVSDVSEIMKHRLQVYQDLKIDDNYAVSADVSLYWGLMANANKLIYWMIISIASSPTLLNSIQAEIKPFAKVTPGSTALELDDEGLLKHCPILKATFFEALRVYTSGTSYKKVLQGLTMKESEEDVKGFNKSTPKTYNIKAGNYLIIYHATMQMDPRLWRDPEKFDPNRFLVEDEKTGTLKADKLHLNAFGGGSTICKGRNYAEREVLIFVAGLLAVYDFSPVEGGWVIPGKFHNGTGTAKPTSSPTIRMSRRA